MSQDVATQETHTETLQTHIHTLTLEVHSLIRTSHCELLCMLTNTIVNTLFAGRVFAAGKGAPYRRGSMGSLFSKLNRGGEELPTSPFVNPSVRGGQSSTPGTRLLGTVIRGLRFSCIVELEWQIHPFDLSFQ